MGEDGFGELNLKALCNEVCTEIAIEKRSSSDYCYCLEVCYVKVYKKTFEIIRKLAKGVVPPKYAKLLKVGE